MQVSSWHDLTVNLMPLYYCVLRRRGDMHCNDLEKDCVLKNEWMGLVHYVSNVWAVASHTNQ
jgi:hypothetical protein